MSESKKRHGRWLGTGMLLCYACQLAGLYVVFSSVADLSKPYYHRRRHGRRLDGLHAGWFGAWLAGPHDEDVLLLEQTHQVDLRDHQWRMFREQLPLILVLAVVHVVVNRLVRRGFRRLVGPSTTATTLTGPSPGSRPRLRHKKQRKDSFRARVLCGVAFSVSLLVYLNGRCVLFALAIVVVSFVVGRVCAAHGWTHVGGVLTWAWAIGVMFSNYYFDGYRFADVLGARFAAWDEPSSRGVMPWHVLFNLVILRMISFNMDLFAGVRRHADPQRHHSSAHRAGGAHSLSNNPARNFSFVVYLYYLFYAPLHIAGPIMDFDSFLKQCQSGSGSFRSIVGYALRLGMAFLLIEVGLHYFYAFGLSHSGARVWTALTPTQVVSLIFASLTFMYLKFLVIWRTFRLWALADGVEPPENMPRCIYDAVSFQSFWRGWHASFNAWLIRYIYVPLGGSKCGLARRVANVFCVFTFVAAWHDQTMQLFAWGWLFALFFVPELIAGHVVSRPWAVWLRRSPAYRYLKAMGAAVQLMLLCALNVIGYNVGLGGFQHYVDIFFGSGWAGAQVVLATFGILTAHALVVLELEDSRAGLCETPSETFYRQFYGIKPRTTGNSGAVGRADAGASVSAAGVASANRRARRPTPAPSAVPAADGDPDGVGLGDSPCHSYGQVVSPSTARHLDDDLDDDDFVFVEEQDDHI